MIAAPRSPTPSQGSHLTPAFERATVADAMHVGIVTCAPDAPLATVARTMASHHVHCIAATRPLGEAVGLMCQHGVTHLVVIDRDTRPIGVLSTLDVVGIVAWGRA